MPWIDENRCVGCAICVEGCPVKAISMENGKAKINMDKCIRCGKCHDICSQNAVRHDSEKIPQDVEENVKWVKNLMKKYKSQKEKQEFLGRIVKHFNKEKTVAEKSLNKIKEIKESKK